MKQKLNHACVLVLLFLMVGPAGAQTPTSSAAIAQSRLLSGQKHFEEAERVLQEVLNATPGDVSLRLEIARIHSWQGRYTLADGELLKLMAEYPKDVDIRFARANLLAFQGKRGEAAALLNEILREQPDNHEARDALAGVERALAAAWRWRLDVGGEYSAFSRQNRSAWNSQFLQISHHFEEDQSSVYGRVERYWQFDRSDVRIETGLAYRFSPALDVNAALGFTPGAVFKPELTLAGGIAANLGEWNEILSGLWLTLDARHDEYAAVSVNEIDPGARLNFAGGWALSGRAIVVKPDDSDAMSGWLVRADFPVSQDWSGFAGVANAPETVAAQTVDTFSFFSGVNVALNDRLTLRFSYTHEDRQDSYIRHVFALSFSQRF